MSASSEGDEYGIFKTCVKYVVCVYKVLEMLQSHVEKQHGRGI
jgi:hypothetical protein